MNRTSIFRAGIALAVIWLLLSVRPASAGCPSWLEALNPFRGTPTDIHPPAACDNCGHELCINRSCEQVCVEGKKKCYKSSIHKEYVSIPETRYKWEMKCIEKEVPCECCMPVCKTEQVDHHYEVEHWEKKTLPCGTEQYCKTCEPKTEQLPVVHDCQTVPGKTTIKVHVWTCVQVPYTVYRQVEKEVGVKQPCYEKVDVTVPRAVCECSGGYDSCPVSGTECHR